MPWAILNPRWLRTIVDRARNQAYTTHSVLVVDVSNVRRAVAEARAVAAAYGLRVDGAVVLDDSNRFAVHLRPCEVLTRVAPRARQNGAEVEVARRPAETGVPDRRTPGHPGRHGRGGAHC